MARTQILMLDIATGDSRPISRQIVDGIRMRIATGELAVGHQLPSVRGLAQQLGINPNTVAKAYGELTAEGWLESRHGLGLFVTVARQRLNDAERTRRFDEAVTSFVSEVVALSLPARDVLSRIEDELSAIAPKKAG